MREEPAEPVPTLWARLADRLDPGSLCPQTRPGIDAFPIVDKHGTQFVVLRNPDGTAFLRLPPWQYEAARSMDGTRSVRDLVGKHFEERGVLDLAGMRSLVTDLRDGGFLLETGQDLYALLARLLPASTGERLQRAAMGLARRWRPVLLQPLLTGACRLLGVVFRPAPVRWIILALALVGLVGPLYSGLILGKSGEIGSGRLALAVLVVLWLGGVFHALAGGAAGAALGRAPRRAGVRLCCGIPTVWIDPREAITLGAGGARLAWLAGPTSLLAAAGAAYLADPGAGNALVLELYLVPLGLFLIAPFRAMAWNDLAAHAWSLPDAIGASCGFGQAVLPLARARTSDAVSARAAARWFDLAALVWLGLVLAYMGALSRAEAWRLPYSLWNAAAPWQAALLVAAIIVVTTCVTLQYCIPALRRFSPSGQPLATLRRRYVSPQARRRLSVLRQCDVLQNLTTDQLTALAEAAVEVRFPSGMDVVVQGEVGDEFYIVSDGVADVIDEGGPVVMQELRKGQSFGKYAMLYHALRAATIRATTDMKLLKIDRPAFDAYLAPRLILEERLKALSEEREFLAAVPALAPLGQLAIDLLLPRLVKERYEPGEVIIRQGDRGDRFYIVRSGTAEVLDESTSPARRLAVLGNGAYFGEIALLLDRPRVATVRTLVEVTVWSLSRTDFDLVLGRYFGLTDSFTITSRKRLEMNRALSA